MWLEFGAMHIEISNRGQLLNTKGSDYLENIALVMLCGEFEITSNFNAKKSFFFPERKVVLGNPCPVIHQILHFYHITFSGFLELNSDSLETTQGS